MYHFVLSINEFAVSELSVIVQYQNCKMREL